MDGDGGHGKSLQEKLRLGIALPLLSICHPERKNLIRLRIGLESKDPSRCSCPPLQGF